MQNKELITHLQKLMAQLQQLQSLGLSQQTPPKSSTPTQDNPSAAETPAAVATPSPRQSSPIPSPSQPTTLPSSPPKSPPIPANDNEAALVPTMTSTPSPTPGQTSVSETKELDTVEQGTLSDDIGSDLKLGTSGFGGLGSLDIDVDLMTTSTLPDDPFAPLPNTSNSTQLIES